MARSYIRHGFDHDAIRFARGYRKSIVPVVNYLAQAAVWRNEAKRPSGFDHINGLDPREYQVQSAREYIAKAREYRLELAR